MFNADPLCGGEWVATGGRRHVRADGSAAATARQRRGRGTSRAVVSVLLALFAAGCGNDAPPQPSAPPPPPPPPAADLSGLQPGWNRITPDGGPVCSDGSPFHFLVRPGDPERVLVYLQGGGGCWNRRTCDPALEPSYTINLAKSDPSRFDGIFRFDRADNPFAAHSMVMVPYCSGDVHLGDVTATYPPFAGSDDGVLAPQPEPLPIEHRGTVNAEAALDWLYRHFRAPREVFVTGSSAGSIPSPFYAARIADRYPDARVTQLGDGAGGYRRMNEVASPVAQWGTLAALAARDPAYAGMDEGAFTFETLYQTAMRQHPNLQFAELDTAEDEVQKEFLARAGVAVESLLPALEANHADIRTAGGNFHAYIAGGSVHTLLGRPEFYSYRVGDRSVRDWVADLAAGRAEDVRCTDCAQPELTTPAASAVNEASADGATGAAPPAAPAPG